MKAKRILGLALVAALLLACWAPAGLAAGSTLKKGMSGPAVTQLQKNLATLGYFTYHTATGNFGSITVDAVSAFQRAQGLAADGIYGPKTAAALEAALSGGGAGGGSSNPSTGATGTVTASSLIVRSGPGTGNSRIGALAKGSKVTILETVNGWHKIQYGSGMGYVSGDYVTATGAAPTSNPTSQPTAAPSGATGTVTASSLIVRSGPGTSNSRIGALAKGSKVTILETVNGWHKIQYGSGTGYVSGDYVTVTGTPPTSNPTTPPTASPNYNYTLKQGMSGDKVTALQTALKAAGFYSYSAITGYYGSITADAVRAFQRTAGLVQDGIAGPKTLSALYGQTPPTTNPGTDPGGDGYTFGRMSISVTLQLGSSGNDVKDLQLALKKKGYYSGSIHGQYDSATRQAVLSFQRASGLTQDGVAGEYVLSQAYTLLDPMNPADILPGKLSDHSQYAIEKLTWQSATTLIPVGKRFTVVDVQTGYSFESQRTGGKNHLDTEPTTRLGTNTMYKMNGGKWSFMPRRPVWVIVDGRRFAASMNCQPHGFETISGNDMVGQYCIHFVGSTTHTTTVPDAYHQAAIEQAYQAGR